MVRPDHVLVGQLHSKSLVVPPQPIPVAGPRPPWRVPSHQHEVVRVRPHEPHLVAVHRHVGLMMEPTHVAQPHVGDPSPEISYNPQLNIDFIAIFTSILHGSRQTHKASFLHLKQV